MSFQERYGAFPRIETPRLVLRELDPQRDEAGRLAVWGDPEVVRFMPDEAQTFPGQARDGQDSRAGEACAQQPQPARGGTAPRVRLV
jgi:hypothetical protein